MGGLLRVQDVACHSPHQECSQVCVPRPYVRQLSATVTECLKRTTYKDERFILLMASVGPFVVGGLHCSGLW